MASNGNSWIGSRKHSSVVSSRLDLRLRTGVGTVLLFDTVVRLKGETFHTAFPLDGDVAFVAARFLVESAFL